MPGTDPGARPFGFVYRPLRPLIERRGFLGLTGVLRAIDTLLAFPFVLYCLRTPWGDSEQEAGVRVPWAELQ
jgi:hypothetical protein